MDIHLSPPADDETAAAVAAAVAQLLAQERAGAAQPTAGRAAWRSAAALEAQNLPPTRAGAHASWHAATRARRAERWSYGIVGI